MNIATEESNLFLHKSYETYSAKDHDVLMAGTRVKNNPRYTGWFVFFVLQHSTLRNIFRLLYTDDRWFLTRIFFLST